MQNVLDFLWVDDSGQYVFGLVIESKTYDALSEAASTKNKTAQRYVVELFHQCQTLAGGSRISDFIGYLQHCLDDWCYADSNAGSADYRAISMLKADLLARLKLPPK